MLGGLIMSFIQFGRRIYYLVFDGSIILDTGEYSGWGYERKPSVDEDFANYEELSNYQQSEIGHIDLEFGQFSEEFVTCFNYRIDPITTQLQFAYPENEFQEPLTIQINELRKENEFLGIEASEREIQQMILGQQISDIEIRLLMGGIL